jgi:hypothetical protein
MINKVRSPSAGTFDLIIWGSWQLPRLERFIF